MKTVITILHVNGQQEQREVDLPEEPGYHTLRDLVSPILNGADIERVNVLHEGGYTDMFVDDSGLLLGLPRNSAATAIYRHNVLTHEPDVDASSLPAIYGDAVLFSRRVWF